MTGDGFAELLARAQAGDEAAFSRLWLDLQPALLRYFQMEPAQSAEDLAADTWESIVKALRRFRGDETAWRAWVFTTARRRALDAARRRARRPHAVPTEDFDPIVLATADCADIVLDRVDTQSAVKLISSLPRHQAEVLALRVLADLPTEVVAAILGRSPGAVRVATHRGLKTLAAALSAHDVTR